jgi:hypothetical protein
VKGMGDTWVNYVIRHKEMLRFMENLKDDDIVIHVDGFDTIVLCPLNEIVRKFKSKKCKVLFSKIADNGSIIQTYFQWKLGFHGLKANAGMFMGYVSKLREVLHRVIESNHTHDQMVINTFIHDDPEIKIDAEQDVFCNILSFKHIEVVDDTLYYKNKSPCILSAPGCVDMNILLEYLDIKKSTFSCDFKYRFKEYTQYFMIEIVVLILILWLVF